MLSLLTTNFTRFFRENHHFDHLRDAGPAGASEAGARPGGRVRIWSAACSDGQEPYSIALTVLSLMPNAADYDFKILATDIDPKILAHGPRRRLRRDARSKPVARPCASSGSSEVDDPGHAGSSRSTTASSG